MKKKERKMVQRLMHDYINTVRGWFGATPGEKIITQATIMATLAQAERNKEEVDEEELKRIAEWVEETHYKFTILGRVLNDEVYIRFFDGESSPKMAYTAYGRECADRRQREEEAVRKHFG